MTGGDIPELQSVAGLASSTDVWFVDIWGVMHNGVQAYEHAVAACRTFRTGGGVVVLVSNSPRPRAGVVRQLEQIGVADDCYDDVVTSGDVTRELISAWSGRQVCHLGPERDRPLFEGINVRLSGPDEADVVVCTGLFDDERETPEDYGDLLAVMRAFELPMICANPDVTVERGGRIIYCAGALAMAYAALGGAVDTAGKPHRPIYEAAMAIGANSRNGQIEKSRVLAIGDGVRTDIAGAAAFGLRSLFIASGVDVRPGENLDAAARRLFETYAMKPVGVMRGLAW